MKYTSETQVRGAGRRRPGKPKSRDKDAAAASRADKRQRVRSKVLEALDGRIEPVRTTGAYRFSLLVVALAMLLMPLLYAAVVFLAGYSLLAYARYVLRLMETTSGAVLVGYALPLFVGGIVLLFLLKPLFAKPLRHREQRALRRDAEPFLYEYVEHVCHAVGAPAPRTISVNCEANASAGFRKDFRSLFSNDLTLTIGLSLVAGLSLRQLTYVLAHEFGHFAQGTSMRLSYLIRSISFWFARIVYERDRWDAWLVRWSRDTDLRIGIVFYAARLFVWLTRWVFLGIMWVGDLLSCHLLRQMEFDADCYGVRVVGSGRARKAARRVREISIAHSMTLDDLERFWDEGRLIDDLPAFVIANTRHMTPEMREKLREYEREQQTGLFDTHPADRDRIARMEAEDAAGLFPADGRIDRLPATVLFNNFEKVSKIVSLKLYREALGPQVKKKMLHPVDDLVARQQAEIDAGKALERYFQVEIPVLRPLPIASQADERPENPRETAAALKEARQRMLEALPDYRKARERYEFAENVMTECLSAIALLQKNLRIKPREFRLEKGTLAEAQRKRKKAENGITHLAGRMLMFESEAGDRLSCALQLLKVPRVVERIPDGEDVRREVRLLLPDAQFVSGLMSELTDFRYQYHGLAALCSRLEANRENRELIVSVYNRMQQMRSKLLSLSEALGGYLYPFDHARGDLTLREYVLPVVPDETDLGGLVAAMAGVLQGLATVQVRLFARLALAAEKVEAAIGLPPLPDPAESPSSEPPAAKAANAG